MKNKLTLTLLTLVSSGFAFAHGTMEKPVSRVLNCYNEGPESSAMSPACAAARAIGGPQPFYDWSGVNQGQANGEHKKFVTDGNLCSGGRDTYKGLDLTDQDWVATPIKADQNGYYDFVWWPSAPHATRYLDLYVTRDGYNPRKPLHWSDLEPQPFCSIKQVELKDGRYILHCPLPNKQGKHIIYAIWQRSDSMEAFYSCSDVDFSAPVTISWNSLGKLQVGNALQVGTKVEFRLMKNTTELERYRVTLQAGQESADSWPQVLAAEVNQSSQFVKLGRLNTQTKEVEIPQSSNDYNVYVRDPNTAGYAFAIDKYAPKDPDPVPPDAGKVDYVYPDGLTQYQPGNIVQGKDGKLYRCKPYPHGHWCKQAVYAPGEYPHSSDAWEQVSK